MEKLEAHQKGRLHRAFSVLLFNSKGEVLLQKRASHKYHSAGLWANTCCSHPRPEEPIEQAVRRRLREELGVKAQPAFAYKFIYKIDLGQGLTEHELDHVFIGTYDGSPVVNPDEVEDWKFMNVAALRKDMRRNPQAYAHWFKLIMADPQLPQRAA